MYSTPLSLPGRLPPANYVAKPRPRGDVTWVAAVWGMPLNDLISKRNNTVADGDEGWSPGRERWNDCPWCVR